MFWEPPLLLSRSTRLFVHPSLHICHMIDTRKDTVRTHRCPVGLVHCFLSLFVHGALTTASAFRVAFCADWFRLKRQWVRVFFEAGQWHVVTSNDEETRRDANRDERRHHHKLQSRRIAEFESVCYVEETAMSAYSNGAETRINKYSLLITYVFMRKWTHFPVPTYQWIRFLESTWHRLTWRWINQRKS